MIDDAPEPRTQAGKPQWYGRPAASHLRAVCRRAAADLAGLVDDAGELAEDLPVEALPALIADLRKAAEVVGARLDQVDKRRKKVAK